MSKINYDKLSEIVVKSQAELDDIPESFKGRIYIEFGTWYNKAVVNKKYYYRVVALGNSSVVALGNSSVEARENSSVEARENSSVEAWGNSSVEARENSSVEAWGNSSVVARENSSVVARENSSVVARENSLIDGNGNSQINDCSNNKAKIKIAGNSRIVYNPKNINDFIDFYGIKHTKTKAIFYKAVRKVGDRYLADYDNNFEYVIGEPKKVDYINTNVNETCGQGIHISHLNWALNFGRDWDNLAIIEVETKIDDIVCPVNTDGKVRTSQVKVLREIPLEECGVYGKILAKQRANKGDK